MKVVQEFKTFLLQGNVVDLAVAVVIGAAFGTLVNSAVEDMITPLIGAVGGTPDFSALSFQINGSNFMYGNFINALISFLIIAAVIFIFVVKPMNSLLTRLKKDENAPAVKGCEFCLSEIPAGARKCKYCSSEVK